LALKSGPRELLVKPSEEMSVQKGQVGGAADPAEYSSGHHENVIFFPGDGL
jgi:hypothetical protein